MARCIILELVFVVLSLVDFGLGPIFELEVAITRVMNYACTRVFIQNRVKSRVI